MWPPPNKALQRTALRAAAELGRYMPGFIAFEFGVRARFGSWFLAKHSRQSVIGFAG